MIIKQDLTFCDRANMCGTYECVRVVIMHMFVCSVCLFLDMTHLVAACS